MKKRLLSFLLLTALPVTFINAQTVLYSETFESGGGGFALNSSDLGGTASGDNPWVINSIYAGGSGSFFCAAFGFNIPFSVPAAPQQPAGITNNPASQYLHITPQIAINSGGNLPTASYIAPDGFCIFGGQSTFSKMTTDVNTTGQDSVVFDFWWDCGGSVNSFGEVYYSTNGGSTWTIMTNPGNGTTQWRGQSTWMNSQLSLPIWSNQSTLRFGFRFITGTTSGTELDPGFSIDDIEIRGYDVCSPSTGTDTQFSCSAFSWIDGNTYNSSNSTATHTIVGGAASGCDSIVTLNLTIPNLSATVSLAGETLTCNETATSYQWVDCNNANAPISGATSQSYMATVNGSYAVTITDGSGCTATSTCTQIASASITTMQEEQLIQLFPNPTKGEFTIELPAGLNKGEIIIRDLRGKTIATRQIQSEKLVTMEIVGAKGVYFVEIITGNRRETMRLIKK